MPAQVLTIKAVEKALSAARFSRYYDQEAGDGDVEATARYLWNMALQAALAPALHLAEVTIRNAVFDATAKVANTRGRPFRDIHCWLDTIPSLLYLNEQQAVEEAKDRLRKLRKPMTPDHLVAKLSFGFWVNLLNASYEQGRASGPALWPTALGAFHGIPRPERTRAALRARFEGVRSFRNRVAHHEAIWDSNPGADYEHLLETLRYLNPGVERALAAMCPFPAVLHNGSRLYIAEAELLIRQQRKQGLAPHC
jgi:hypothetical protein